MILEIIYLNGNIYTTKVVTFEWHKESGIISYRLFDDEKNMRHIQVVDEVMSARIITENNETVHELYKAPYEKSLSDKKLIERIEHVQNVKRMGILSTAGERNLERLIEEANERMLTLPKLKEQTHIKMVKLQGGK